MIWIKIKSKRTVPVTFVQAKFKQKIHHFFLVTVLFILSVNVSGQTTTQGNTNGSPAYLGWDIGQNFPLLIQHEGSRSIKIMHTGRMRLSINPFGGIGVGGLNNGNLTRVEVNADANNGGRGISVSSDIFNLAPSIVGGWFYSDGSAREDYALTGRAFDGNGLVLVGVNARASGASISNIGLLAEDCANGLAGYFNGDILVTGMLVGPSDASLKIDVESLGLLHTNKLSDLKIYSYHYNQNIAAINLPNNISYGLMAQEVVEVFPSIVDTTFVPKRYGEDDELLTDTMSHLNIDYLQFIALAVNTYQHQDSLILDNADKLNILKNRLNEIKLSKNGESKSKIVEVSIPEKGQEKLVLYPNPAEGIIVIEFETENRINIINLKIVDSTGKIVLEEKGNYNEGLHKLTLPISHLKAGIYELQLTDNNEKSTKKFIKR